MRHLFIKYELSNITQNVALQFELKKDERKKKNLNRLAEREEKIKPPETNCKSIISCKIFIQLWKNGKGNVTFASYICICLDLTLIGFDFSSARLSQF